jgi:hypothetical protein
MVIGRVISEFEIDLGERFEWLTEPPEDITVPMIYVGMVKTNEWLQNEADDLDILTRRINDRDWWTFTKKEHRSLHANDLMLFREFCYHRLIKDVKYEFIDPLLLSDDEHKKAFDKLKGCKTIISCNVGDMVYMYDTVKTYGINLMFYQIVGADRTKMLKRIKAISTVFLEAEEILIEYNDFMGEYENDFMYLPFLYSMKTDVT